MTKVGDAVSADGSSDWFKIKEIGPTFSGGSATWNMASKSISRTLVFLNTMASFPILDLPRVFPFEARNGAKPCGKRHRNKYHGQSEWALIAMINSRWLVYRHKVCLRRQLNSSSFIPRHHPFLHCGRRISPQN